MRAAVAASIYRGGRYLVIPTRCESRPPLTTQGAHDMIEQLRNYVRTALAARRRRAIRARNARIVAAAKPTQYCAFEEVPPPKGQLACGRRIRMVKRKL